MVFFGYQRVWSIIPYVAGTPCYEPQVAPAPVRRFVWVIAALAMLLPVDVSGQTPIDRSAPPAVVPSSEQSQSTGGPSYPRWWGAPPEIETAVPCTDPGKCVTCHKTQGTMDPSHALSCEKCHGGNPDSDNETSAHAGLIKDPGDLRTLDKTCGKCHPEVAKRVKRSPMALAPGMINHVRFAFGGQSEPSHLYATVSAGNLKEVPLPSASSNLGDDLLRRSCLRCHLWSAGSDRRGEIRGRGCTACHSPRGNGPQNDPCPHVIVRSVGMTACLKCHNSNHIGADFVGLFEKDFARGFVSPLVEGRAPETIYGAEQHRLVPDIHYQKGMECLDCHTVDSVHGSDEGPASGAAAAGISCEGCHVRGDHPYVLKAEDGRLSLMRGQGRRIPAFDPAKVPHSVEEHRQKVGCSACHAAWSFQDYGLHLMLEERADYWKWAPYAGQNDPQVQALLLRNIGTDADLIPPKGPDRPARPSEQWEQPSTKDWLSGEVRSGAWFRGYTLRRWSDPPLGRDSSGRISVMRPMYQYVVSHVDAQGKLLLDSRVPTTGQGTPALIFNPYQPHTTAGRGRNCQECHGNPKAIGLGESLKGIAKPIRVPLWKTGEVPELKQGWDAIVDEQGTPLQFSSYPSAGPLAAGTVHRLLNPTDRYRALWHRYQTGHPQPNP